MTLGQDCSTKIIVFLSSFFPERFFSDNIKCVIFRFSESFCSALNLVTCMFYTMIVNYVYIHNMYVYEIVRDSKIVQRYNVLCIVPFVHQIFSILSKDSFDKKFLCFLT